MYAIFQPVESQCNSARGREKTLVLFPGALGDFVCFLPALHELARGRAVDLLARSEYGDLLPPHIHAGTIERREIGRLFVAGADLRETAELFRPYAAVYSWTGSGDAVFRTNFAAAAGVKGKLFPFRPALSRSHIADYYLACVGAAAGGRPAVALKADALAWARAWLRAEGLDTKRILTVAPGSGATEKNWPREYFRAVIDWWRRSCCGEALVVLGPAEDADASAWTPVAAVARNQSLARLAALLSLSEVYLGNDSGVTHLAAAAGAETLALFGPTDAAEWAPRGPRVSLVSRGVECSPCARPMMKTCPHRKCLNTLYPHKITPVLAALMGRNSGGFALLDKGVGSH